MVSRWKDFVTTKVCPTPWVNEWTFTPLLGVPFPAARKTNCDIDSVSCLHAVHLTRMCSQAISRADWNLALGLCRRSVQHPVPYERKTNAGRRLRMGTSRQRTIHARFRRDRNHRADNRRG